jgi:hypothetical protein
VVAVDFDAVHMPPQFRRHAHRTERSRDGFRQRHVRPSVQRPVRPAGAAVDGHPGFQPSFPFCGKLYAQVVHQAVAAGFVEHVQITFHPLSLLSLRGKGTPYLENKNGLYPKIHHYSLNSPYVYPFGKRNKH